MKNISYFIFIVFFGFTACNSDESISQESELKTLQEQFEEITNMVEDATCDDPNNWTFTAYGSKACGGPQGFIAYPLTIDTITFLEKIEAYNLAEEQFNRKWGVISDCALVPSPESLMCENGKPVLIYSF